MFEKNLKVIELKNPELAKKLREINITSIAQDFEVFNSDSNSNDIILSYKGNLLHDKNNPIREAMFAWNKSVKGELKPKDIQIVFGFGLGYLFKRAYINAPSRIYVYEPIIEILRFVLEYVDFTKEFADDRVFITNSYEEIHEKLTNEYLKGDRVEFLFLNAYASIATEQLLQLTEQTFKICEGRAVDQNTIFNLCKKWTVNSINNMKFFSKSIPAGYFAGKFAKKPVLILASGPSLGENFEKIKKNRDKFIVIAVGQAIKFLQGQKFVPDFMAFADSENMFTLVDGYADFVTDQDYLKQNNLIVSSRADSYLFTKDVNSVSLYFTKTDEIARWAVDSSKDDLGLYESGGTVAIMCYAFAKSIGATKIVFAGLDLAFINNKIYAHGTELKVNEKDEINLGYDLLTPKKLIKVKDKDGNYIPTRDDYASFIRHFEDIFAKKAPDEIIINTSLKGAYVKGMDYLSFDNVIKNLEKTKEKININELIKTVIQDNTQRWNNTLVNIKNALEIQKQEIIEIKNSSQSVYSELSQICLLFESKELHSNLVQAKIENVKEEMLGTRDKVLKNVFLSNYLQGEILDYTKKYRMSILPRVDDIKHNMSLEKDLYQKFLATCDELLALIDLV